MRSADGEHDRVRERACAQSLRAFTSGGSACVWRDAARSPQRIRCVAQLVAVHRERVQGAALAHHARARRRLEWRRRLGLSDRVRARALSGRVRSAAPSAAAATAAAVAAAAAHAHQGRGRGRRRQLDQLRRVRERACAQSLRAFTSGGSACVWRDAARSPQRIRCVAQLVAVHRERVQGAALAHHARARRRLEWRRRLGLSDRVRARALSGRVRSAAPSAAAATAAAVAAAAAHAHQSRGRGRRRQLDQLRRARGREKLVHGEAALVREQVVMSVLSAPCGERTTAATSCSAGRSATRQPESSTS